MERQRPIKERSDLAHDSEPVAVGNILRRRTVEWSETQRPGSDNDLKRERSDLGAERPEARRAWSYSEGGLHS